MLYSLCEITDIYPSVRKRLGKDTFRGDKNKLGKGVGVRNKATYFLHSVIH